MVDNALQMEVSQKTQSLNKHTHIRTNTHSQLEVFEAMDARKKNKHRVHTLRHNKHKHTHSLFTHSQLEVSEAMNARTAELNFIMAEQERVDAEIVRLQVSKTKRKEKRKEKPTNCFDLIKRMNELVLRLCCE